MRFNYYKFGRLIKSVTKSCPKNALATVLVFFSWSGAASEPAIPAKTNSAVRLVPARTREPIRPIPQGQLA